MTITAFPIGRPGRAAPGGLRDAPFDSRTVGQLASLFTSLPRSTRMADDADQAHDNEAQHLAVSLSTIDPAMPKGVRGECENCGEDMPRLVGGLCGFCRDGRRPSFQQRPQWSGLDTSRHPKPMPIDPEPAEVRAIAAEVVTTPAIGVQPEEDEVPNPKPSDDFRNVSILARGPLLTAILKRASERELSLNKAATSLIEDALTPSIVQPAATLHDLSTVSMSDLMDELIGRVETAPTPDLLAAAIARAEAAEGQLAAIQQLLAIVRPQA